MIIPHRFLKNASPADFFNGEHKAANVSFYIDFAAMNMYD